MFRRMQESGLIEILPFTCILDIQCQCPAFSVLNSFRAHSGRWLQWLLVWWMKHALLTDLADDIFPSHTSSQISMAQGMGGGDNPHWPLSSWGLGLDNHRPFWFWHSGLLSVWRKYRHQLRRVFTRALVCPTHLLSTWWRPQGICYGHIILKDLLNWNHLVSFHGSTELQYHSPLCLSTENNSARGKVIDKKWFIRIGCLWG